MGLSTSKQPPPLQNFPIFIVIRLRWLLSAAFRNDTRCHNPSNHFQILSQQFLSSCTHSLLDKRLKTSMCVVYFEKKKSRKRIAPFFLPRILLEGRGGVDENAVFGFDPTDPSFFCDIFSVAEKSYNLG